MSSPEALGRLWNELYDGEHADELRSLLTKAADLKRSLSLPPLAPEWYKEVVVYSLYVDLFNGTFEGLIERLDYLEDLGITCLWLLPVLESPMRDAGFDISDFRKVRTDLVRAEDRDPDDVFDELVSEAHRRGIAIIFDIALNHSSSDHRWFQSSKDDPTSQYRDFYIWSDTDQLYREARVIFKGMMDSNWTRHGDQFFFHRFFDTQPDLNYRNPRVLVEMTLTLLGWLARGIDGFRADAVPYLWKEAGTNCENLPKTHVIVKFFRAALDYLRPGAALIAEANQPPLEVAKYFGDGDECNAAYHFPLMPRMFRALATADRTAITETLSPAVTPPIPPPCQWFTFLRCHDELTLEMVTTQERKLIYDYYVQDPLWDFREGEGISARLAPLLGNDPRRINLLNSILLSLIGTPIVFYGDEFGKGNDLEYYEMKFKQTGYPDSRNLARGPLDWEHLAAELADPMSLAANVFYPLREMIAERRKHPSLSRGALTFLELGDPRLLGYRRSYDGNELTVLANLSAEDVAFPYAGGTATLAAFEYRWL